MEEEVDDVEEEEEDEEGKFYLIHLVPDLVLAQFFALPLLSFKQGKHCTRLILQSQLSICYLHLTSTCSACSEEAKDRPRDICSRKR